MAKTFKTWIKQFIDDDTPYGDLAQDIKRDFIFPTENDRETISDHLNDHGACYEAISTFHHAWTDYKNEVINK